MRRLPKTTHLPLAPLLTLAHAAHHQKVLWRDVKQICITDVLWCAAETSVEADASANLETDAQRRHRERLEVQNKAVLIAVYESVL